MSFELTCVTFPGIRRPLPCPRAVPLPRRRHARENLDGAKECFSSTIPRAAGHGPSRVEFHVRRASGDRKTSDGKTNRRAWLACNHGEFPFFPPKSPLTSPTISGNSPPRPNVRSPRIRNQERSHHRRMCHGQPANLRSPLDLHVVHRPTRGHR
jgi:hypothetical protein